MGYILYLVPTGAVDTLYENQVQTYLAKPYHERDAGFDLYTSITATVDHESKLDMGCVAACYDTDRGLFRAYWMLPRSSISKTPLQMSNSVGLIDAGYRGKLLAPVRNTCRDPYSVSVGDRLFQIATPDLLPWDDIRIVEVVPGGATLRGAGGFGSTG